MNIWVFSFCCRYLVSRQDWHLWIVGDLTAYLYQLFPLSALLFMVNFWNYPHAGKYYVKVWFMIIFSYLRRGKKQSYLSYVNVLVLYKTWEKYVKLILHFFLNCVDLRNLREHFLKNVEINEFSFASLHIHDIILIWKHAHISSRKHLLCERHCWMCWGK